MNLKQTIPLPTFAVFLSVTGDELIVDCAGEAVKLAPDVLTRKVCSTVGARRGRLAQTVLS